MSFILALSWLFVGFGFGSSLAAKLGGETLDFEEEGHFGLE